MIRPICGAVLLAAACQTHQASSPPTDAGSAAAAIADAAPLLGPSIEVVLTTLEEFEDRGLVLVDLDCDLQEGKGSMRTVLDLVIEAPDALEATRRLNELEIRFRTSDWCSAFELHETRVRPDGQGLLVSRLTLAIDPRRVPPTIPPPAETAARETADSPELFARTAAVQARIGQIDVSTSSRSPRPGEEETLLELTPSRGSSGYSLERLRVFLHELERLQGSALISVSLRPRPPAGAADRTDQTGRKECTFRATLAVRES